MVWKQHSLGLSMPLQEVDVLGIPVTCLASYRDTVAYITRRIRTGDRLYCVAINPVKIRTALENTRLAQILKDAGIHICDGIGTALAVRLLHGRHIRRITGAQLFFDLVEMAEREGLRVFLLGASPESNELACQNLLRRHPKLKIVGRHHGYCDGDDAVVALVNASRPDILFVAMGSPKQEYWIARYRERMSCPFVMGVGGTFDVASGKVKWAPPFFRWTGTEFLYRFCRQPWRFKNSSVLFGFAFAVLKKRIYSRSPGRRSLAQ